MGKSRTKHKLNWLKKWDNKREKPEIKNNMSLWWDEWDK